MFVQSALTAGGLTTASATSYYPRQKQEAGRSLSRPADPMGRTSPASTRCLKWKPCSNSWLTVRGKQAVNYFGRNSQNFSNTLRHITCVNLTDSERAAGAWIGLRKPSSASAVEWSDGSPVTLTLWHQYQPPRNLTDTALCAKAESQVGNYKWLISFFFFNYLFILLGLSKQKRNIIHPNWNERC